MAPEVAAAERLPIIVRPDAGDRPTVNAEDTGAKASRITRPLCNMIFCEEESDAFRGWGEDGTKSDRRSSVSPQTSVVVFRLGLTVVGSPRGRSTRVYRHRAILLFRNKINDNNGYFSSTGIVGHL